MKPLNEWLHKDAAGDGNTTPQKQIPRGQSAFIPQKPLVSGGPHAQSAENAGKGFPLRMYPLGGFEQIGRNSFVVEVDGDIYIIDLGLQFPDEEMLARAMLAPGLIVDLIGVVGEEAVRTAIIDALVPYRAPNGTYRLENEWHTLIASA